MRTYGVAPDVRVPAYPLFMLPTHLGATTTTAISAGAAIGGKVAGSAVTSAASSAGWGAAAGPIGAAVAVGIGLIAGLLAAHEQRKKEAQNENAAVNLGVSGFDQGIQQIVQAFTSGSEDVSTCEQAAELLITNFWDEVNGKIQPGRNGCNTGASCPGQSIPANYCSGSIGAACCVGCESLVRSITGPDGVLAALAGSSTSKSGPTSADIYQVFASSYGTSGRAGYTVTFTPPGGAGALNSVESAVGGGNGLLLIGLALGAFFLLR